MARVLLEGRSVSEDAVEAIHERTDGIPLHVEELVGMFADRSVATADDVRTSDVPETIEATVLERLRHRSDAAQAIAAAGAVVGRRFLPSVVGRIVELPDERLAEPLDELVAHAFLEPSARTGEVDFRNQLLRDAVYARDPRGRTPAAAWIGRRPRWRARHRLRDPRVGAPRARRPER